MGFPKMDEALKPSWTLAPLEPPVGEHYFQTRGIRRMLLSVLQLL
jgi:hypothetical protein